MLYPVLREFKKFGLPFHGLTFPDDVSDSLLLNQEWVLWRTAPSGLARPRTGRLKQGVHYMYVSASVVIKCFPTLPKSSNRSCLLLTHVGLDDVLRRQYRKRLPRSKATIQNFTASASKVRGGANVSHVFLRIFPIFMPSVMRRPHRSFKYHRNLVNLLLM
jgi:hypothetical protein